MKTVAEDVIPTEQVRRYVRSLPGGTEFAASDIQRALSDISVATVNSALRAMRTVGELSHNGKKAQGARYRTSKAKAPQPRQPEPDPLDAIDPIPPTQPSTEIEILRNTSAGTVIYVPDGLPVDGEWKEMVTLPKGFDTKVVTLPDGRTMVFVARIK